MHYCIIRGGIIIIIINYASMISSSFLPSSFGFFQLLDSDHILKSSLECFVAVCFCIEIVFYNFF
jgi:hypothetical protein